MSNEIHFRGSPTLNEFLANTDADVKLVQGPVESGKSGACMAQIYIWMCQMPRSRDGIRRSRFLISRGTFGELQTTVIRDFLEWFPEEKYGVFKHTEPYSYKMKFLDVECTVDFISFGDEKPETLRKLRSTQYTGAWVNEGQFISLRLWTEIVDRTGRYPSKRMCPAYDRRKRAILDNNAPLSHDNWMLYMRGDTPIPSDMASDQAMAYELPDSWQFYLQPAAVLEVKDEKGNLVGYELNPEAENLQNMGDNPYSNFGGKERDQIDRDYRNITRSRKGGAARYPKFNRDKQVAKEHLQPYEGSPIILGMDFGTTPACMFCQNVDGRWYVYWEIVEDNAVTAEIAPKIKEVLATRFPFHTETGVVAWGDPAGGWGGEQSSSLLKTSYQILNHFGIPMRAPAKKDRPQLRMETGRAVINEYPGGDPKLLIDPRCRRLINALDGGMRMRTQRIDGTENIREVLIKDQHSHPGEAFEYALWGGGEAKTLLAPAVGQRRTGPINTLDTQSIWQTRGGASRPARKRPTLVA